MSRTFKANKKQLKESPSRNVPIRVYAVGGLVLLALTGGGLVFADWWTCLPSGTKATYVGRNSCITCHAAQGREWTDSHHDLAMDLATDKTVLGDFEDAVIEHFGIKSRMFRKDGRFLVNTEGPDGEMLDFEVKYVFGVEPLQQYMVEFDRTKDMQEDEIARLQVLRISWDTKNKKWFYLSPPDVDESVERLSPDDDLHWTGIAQRWNNMCADCHSTNLQKSFDVKKNQYHTTFSEIDVSCEACHGPGSIHVELAKDKSLFWDRKLGYGLAKLKGKNPEPEIQTCATCHSRRRFVHPGFKPGENYNDFFATELLHDLTYHADGQIKDEVYVHGSFTQSKMYHKGIRCSDCHNPHTTKLKFQGNKVCTSCHAHAASKYDTIAHHHHREGSTGASCVECHMPETTYMDVDPRRDHSLRIPRPDLSVDLGTPNACSGCHLEKATIPSEKRESFKQYADWIAASNNGDKEVAKELLKLDKWSSDHVKKWYGEKERPIKHFAYALSQARSDDPSERQASEPTLIALAKSKTTAAIVRATALFEMGDSESPDSLKAAVAALRDPNPQVRAAALTRFETEIAITNNRVSATSEDAIETMFNFLIGQLVPLLEDDVRLVRTEAARVLAGVPTHVLQEITVAPQRKAWRAALDEFKAGIHINGDRAGAHMTLAILHEQLGDDGKAIIAYKTAIRVEPTVTGPRTNLAAINDRLAEDADRRARQAASQRDRDTVMQMAKLVGKYRGEAEALRREELNFLERDARLAPDNAMIQYRYGLSLYLHDRSDEAEKYLISANDLDEYSPQFTLALALLYQKQERWSEALEFAKQLVTLRPDDQSYQQLLSDIKRQSNVPAGPSSSDQ